MNQTSRTSGISLMKQGNSTTRKCYNLGEK